MKIAVVTNFDRKNYGSILQAYALQCKLKELGAKESIVLNKTNTQKKSSISKLKNILKKSANGYSLRNRYEIKKAQKMFADKNRELNLFCANNIDSIHCISNKEASELSKEYDLFIAGSDQIWSSRAGLLSPYTLLDFVSKDVPKYSYAASIGTKTISDNNKKIFEEMLSKFNEISVRENSAKLALQQCVNENIRVDVDPTLLYDNAFWSKQVKEKIYNEPYIFVYMLRPEPHTINLAKKLSEKTGYKVKICSNRIIEKDIFENITNAGIEDFLTLIHNAKYIITNSFHGTVFSMQFHKKFLSVAVEGTGSRVIDLLTSAGLQDRIITDKEEIDKIYKEESWDIVEEKINNYRQQSIEYIKKMIEDNTKPSNKIILYNLKKDCCGCSACMNACPQGAITMVKDLYGFIYPKIDENKCVKCGLCKKACNYQKNKNKNKILKSYAALSEEKKLLKKSASGGIFSAIANEFLHSGGIVFGCSLERKNGKLFPEHIMINNTKNLYKLQGSKYVQSSINFTYKEVLKQLEEGKKVLFSGTPCQISGLYGFLKNKKYNNLFTMEIVCHGVPNADLFQGYLDWEAKKTNKKINNIIFRDKKYGWSEKGTIFFKNKNKTKGKEIDIYNSSYYRLFITAGFNRESCYNCNCKGKERNGDITIGDFWGIDETYPELLANNGGELNKKEGISCLFVNSENGNNLLNKYGKKIKLIEVDSEKIIEKNPAIVKPNRENKDRNTILSVFYNGNYENIDKWYNKRYGKRIMILGIWNKVPKNIRTKIKKVKRLT